MTLAFLQDAASGKSGTPLNIQVTPLSHFDGLGNQILSNSTDCRGISISVKRTKVTKIIKKEKNSRTIIRCFFLKDNSKFY